MQTFPVVDTVPPVKPMVRRQAYRNVRPVCRSIKALQFAIDKEIGPSFQSEKSAGVRP